jgi:signal transduction histidine kinase
VRKHAPGAATTVTLRRDEEELRVSVHNDRAATQRPDLGPGGHGLAGMAERVRLYGGRLHAEAVADGFRVDAGIPLVAS